MSVKKIQNKLKSLFLTLNSVYELKLIHYASKSVQICFGNFREYFYPKKKLKQIWANLAIFSFRIQDSRNCSKDWILKDFLKIEKSSKRSSYRPVDHLLRSSMLPKVFPTTPRTSPEAMGNYGYPYLGIIRVKLNTHV